MNRTKSSIRNIAFTMAGSIVTMLLQLINRRVFVNYLTGDYLGLNGLFSNILSMLSLSELGVGTAMVYAMYKPVAEQDREKIKSLMQLYQKLYRVIGGFVLIAGMSLTPFLHLFIREMPDIPYIHLYYMMFVADAGLSYFYTYKRSLILCNQENYISTATTMFSNVCARAFQLLVLMTTHNYFLFLLVQILFTRLENVLISRIADSRYPFLREKDVKPLAKEDTLSIKKNIFAMMAHKLESVIVGGTDSLIISRILGLGISGLYSNYVLLINFLNGLIGKVFGALTASIGNLVADKGNEKSKTVFLKILFMNYWIFNLCTVCVFCLLQPFMRLWLGNGFLLPDLTVYVTAILFYVNGMRRTVLEFRNATGIFWHDRYAALAEAGVNLAASIPLTYLLGVAGVKLGSVIALLTTTFWIEGLMLYRHFFRTSCRGYLKKQAAYGLLTLGQCLLLNAVCSGIDDGTILSFLLQCLLCFGTANLAVIAVFGRTEEFRYYLNMGKTLAGKIRIGKKIGKKR